MEKINFLEINSISLVEAAKAYALAGLPVFPAQTVNRDGSCSCGNQDCNSIGKHPRTNRGFKDATTDIKKIENWWTKMPDSNIAIPTGAMSGLFVLDVDKKSNGLNTFEEFEKRFGKLPTTLKNITGGGGFHLIFKHSGMRIKSVSGVLEGLDIRADGGCIIVPPSIHKSGNKYQWAVEQEEL